MAMYTEEQAKEVLMNKMYADMEKQIALLNHKTAIDWIERYSLPYRISLDYIKNTEHKDNEVRINEFYPLSEIPKDAIWDYEKDGGYTLEQWCKLTFRDLGEVTKEGKKVMEIYTPPEIQALKDKKAEPYKSWNLKTEQGKEKWLYYFMVFIMPYKDKISTWSSFDMFGDTKHTSQELEERKRYYLGLIDKCINNPTLYKHSIAVKEELRNEN